jgi:hypothetical protein
MALRRRWKKLKSVAITQNSNNRSDLHHQNPQQTKQQASTPAKTAEGQNDDMLFAAQKAKWIVDFLCPFFGASSRYSFDSFFQNHLEIQILPSYDES